MVHSRSTQKIKESLFKSLFSAVASVSDQANDTSASARGPGAAVRDIISGLASIAGKGKDEIVQIISREIGLAVAGVIKEPLLKILENRKIMVSLELVERDHTTLRTSVHEKTSKKKK